MRAPAMVMRSSTSSMALVIMLVFTRAEASELCYHVCPCQYLTVHPQRALLLLCIVVPACARCPCLRCPCLAAHPLRVCYSRTITTGLHFGADYSRRAMFVVGTQDSCWDSHARILDGAVYWGDGACPASSVVTKCACLDTKDDLIQELMDLDNSAEEAEEIWQDDVAENNGVEPLCVSQDAAICDAAGAVWKSYTNESHWIGHEDFDVAQCAPGHIGECHVARCPINLNSKSSDARAERISSVAIAVPIGLVVARLLG